MTSEHPLHDDPEAWGCAIANLKEEIALCICEKEAHDRELSEKEHVTLASTTPYPEIANDIYERFIKHHLEESDLPPTYTRADLEAFAMWVLESHWLTPSLHYRNNPAALVEAWEKERAALQKKAGE